MITLVVVFLFVAAIMHAIAEDHEAEERKKKGEKMQCLECKKITYKSRCIPCNSWTVRFVENKQSDLSSDC